MPGATPPTASVKAKPDAACPDGNEEEVGIWTRDAVPERRFGGVGTPSPKPHLAGQVHHGGVTATAAMPFSAARRPVLPPTSAIAPEIPNHSFDRVATSDGSPTGFGSSSMRWRSLRPGARADELVGERHVDELGPG